MSVINIRVSGPAQLTGAAATKYTVPANAQLSLKHIHVENPSNAAVGFTMSIGADAAATRIYDNFSISAGGVLDVFCMYVLNAAEILQAFASVTSVLTLTLDGTLIQVP
ncbi:MAG: hypothetical protein ACRENK_16530 [Gemmatimonadaceae bacterium]